MPWSKVKVVLIKKWNSDPDSAIKYLASWLGPLDRADLNDMRKAVHFLKPRKYKNAQIFMRKIKVAGTNRKKLSEATKTADSCLYELIGELNEFLRNRHKIQAKHNRKLVIAKANRLLDDCFECRRSIYMSGDNTDQINKQICRLKTKVPELKSSITFGD